MILRGFGGSMNRSMKQWLKQKYWESDWGFRLLFPWVRARDYLAGGWVSSRRHIEKEFEATFGTPLDWGHPRTLNEKLNWMKLNVKDPVQCVAADKYAVRELVREKIGEDHLIPLIRAYDRPEDIHFADLPDAFVLKVNHGSGQNWIVRDKHKENEYRLIRQFKEWFRTSHYLASREWPYKDMRPMIVAEELLLDEKRELPCDYKFHCFGGKVGFIQVDLDSEIEHRRNFYDLEWHLQNFFWTEWEGEKPSWPNGPEVPQPDGLEEMIRIAEVLAADFPYVRIDLFYCQSQVYFGEITFYHGGAFERFDPPEFDLRFGEMLNLPSKTPSPR